MMRFRMDTKFENLIFFLYFLNKDISFNIPYTFLKFGRHILDYLFEGSMSQIFYLGPSFYFMQS